MIGRYRIGPLLGAGGYAVVWLARDESLDTTIAIKVMAENWATHTDLRDRFLAEARMLRRAASNRVVQVFDIGELSDGRPYFVMEHADRGTLLDRIARRRLPLVEALRLTAEVARGAAELHRLGIVHRDLKPSNVLIQSVPDGTERLLIADLGIAKNLTQSTGVTVSVGSTGYMAPEQAMPGSRVDARADVYSLGALGFHLITDQQPGSWGPILPAQGADTDFPEPVLQVLRQALEPERGRRWPDAASLADRLDQLADEGESASRAGASWPSEPQPTVSAVAGVPPPAGSDSAGSDPEPRSAPGISAGAGPASSRASAAPGPGPARRSRSGRRSKARRGWSSRLRDRRMVLPVGLLILVLVWVAVQSTGGPAGKAGATTGLPDGEHYGLLAGSSPGRVTFNLITLHVGDEAKAKCRQEFGAVPANAVCGEFYFSRTERAPRTLQVDKRGAIGYIVNVDRKGVLFSELTGADVDKLDAVSKRYQQGRLFAFRTRNGIFVGGRQEPLGCKDIDGLVVDGRTEWISKCVKRFGI
jgi:serine/threonine protein kinase